MIRTAASDLLRIEHPIVQAGMARVYTSAALVAAVSAAGGLGVLGCLDRPAAEAAGEIRRIRSLTDRPFGATFVLHLLDEQTFAACLAERVPVFCFFRGVPHEAVARAHQAGATVLYQVTTVEEAEEACAAGVDGLIAQGREAGGHMGPLALQTLLPEVVAVAGERPVLAAGGIVDGRGLAAMLCLGAQGVVMGTRFLATPECPISDGHKQAILTAAVGATVASGVPDLIWGQGWPGVQARAMRNQLLSRWLGREIELPAKRPEVLATLQQAEAADDPQEMVVLAGEGAGRIRSLAPAGQIVRQTAAEAEAILRQWGARLG